MLHAASLRPSPFTSDRRCRPQRPKLINSGTGSAQHPAAGKQCETFTCIYDARQLKGKHIVGDGSCDHLDDQNIPLPDEIKLTTGLFEVGREPPADIVVSVPTVSTRHAMLRLENDKLSITDLNSTNGTYIDDEELVPMRAMEISLGAEVTFGDMFLAKFKLEDRESSK